MRSLLIATGLFITVSCAAQDASSLLNSIRAKLELVNDYVAKAKLKTNVAFLKVPVSTVSVYYKKPNKIKIKSEKGISFVPKGAMNINLSNILASKKFTVIDAGKDKVNGKEVRVVKLLPEDDNDDIVLSTLYIDAAQLLVVKAKTTTKENGTYELEMTYGKYSSYALPDKVIFSFNTKDYKLPKGVTFDFDDGKSTAPSADKMKNKKGKAEIVFSNYVINQGVSEKVFL